MSPSTINGMALAALICMLVGAVAMKGADMALYTLGHWTMLFLIIVAMVQRR